MKPVIPTVYLIDDDENIRSYLSVLPSALHLAIKIFNSAESFLAYYQRDMSGCLITDVFLSGMSGIELQKFMHANGYQLPVIFVSATHDVSITIKAFKAGAFDFIERPKLNMDLVPAIQNAINHDEKIRTLQRKKVSNAVKLYAESIVETVRQPLFVLDHNLNIVLVNQYSYNMFEVSEDQVDYQFFEKIISDIPQLRHYLCHLIYSGQELIDCEISFHMPEFGIKTLILNARNLILNDSQEKHILLALDDITTRKNIEQALYQEKEQALVTLQSIGEAVITMDKDGYIEYLNPIAEKLTEWSQSLAKGQPIDVVVKLVSEESVDQVINPIALCLRRQETVNIIDNLALVSRNKHRISIELTTAIINDKNDEVSGLVLAFKDVSTQRKLAEELSYQATHDVLTGLVNRREFEKRLSRAIKSSAESANHHVLCFLDLDQFKVVNDSAGHRAGDELLKQISQIIQENIRGRDTLARIGGDEFGVILENCPIEKAISIAELLIFELGSYRFVWQDDIFTVGLSIGIAPITENINTSEHLLSRADLACYTAKEQGRNRCYVYDDSNNKPAQKYSEVLRAAGLTNALEKDQFRLFCQPIYLIRNGERRISSYEILVRLVGDDGELIAPGSFIPAAERYGLMVGVDRWVIKNALKQFSERTSENEDTCIAINLSGNSLNDKGLLEYVEQQFTQFSVDPGRICFEITETAAVHNINRAIEFIKALKKKGCSFSLDDFGSGLSSFSYLQQLPIDYLKIDGSFVRDIATNAVDRAMVVAINEIGHTMGIDIIAEYAESEAVIDELKLIGVDYAQGFALQKPVALETVLH